jgi:autoinducer 2-degrading protein
MKIVSVKFTLKPEFAERFLQVSLGDAQGSVRNEPGCYRFDVFRAENDPNIICFYEVYQDDAAFAAHQAMPHYQTWRDAWQPDWLAAETEVVIGSSVYPPDEAWTK